MSWKENRLYMKSAYLSHCFCKEKLVWAPAGYRRSSTLLACWEMCLLLGNVFNFEYSERKELWNRYQNSKMLHIFCDLHEERGQNGLRLFSSLSNFINQGCRENPPNTVRMTGRGWRKKLRDNAGLRGQLYGVQAKFSNLDSASS